MGQWTEEQPKKDKNFCNEYIVFFVDEKKLFFSLSYKLGQRANLRIICVCVSVGRVCGWRGWN